MTKSVDLRTGRLTVAMDARGMPLNELCGFGSRNNPKRGFLFVSRMLGKHMPTRASSMLDAHRRLAEQLSDDLGSAVFIGMAETATGLGQGVFEAYRALNVSRGSAYIQTTRYVLDDAESIEFKEPHSHSVQQYVYVPENVAAREQLEQCRTLVLVDDEISTGTTLCNLVVSCKAIYPHIQRVVLVCLTDFSRGRAADLISVIPGIKQASTVSLASGKFHFENNPAFEYCVLANSTESVSCRRHLNSPYSARLGTTAALSLPPKLLAQCLAVSGPRTLVVGTGEFMHAAFCLALALEENNITAFVQSTTRSPILLDQDITSAVPLPDLYGEKIPNFIYNFNREDYDAVLVVYEAPRSSDSDELCRILDAHSVCLADHSVINNHEFSE